MSESVTLKSYFYEVLIPSSQKNTSSPIEDILHHVSKYIFYEKACALQMFQSTHPHGVRPHPYPDIILVNGVSIHAPTRGATRHTGDNLHEKDVSIHAPTRGATILSSTFRSAAVFQSTHPHGVRLRLQKSDRLPDGFNPRTHTGCDPTPNLSLC